MKMQNHLNFENSGAVYGQNNFQNNQDGIDYLEQGIDNIGRTFDNFFRFLFNAFNNIYLTIKNFIEWIMYGDDEYE